MTDTYVVDAKTKKATILKDPSAVLDYPFDWTDWLDALDDNIAATPDPTFVATEGVVVGALLKDGTRGTGRNYFTNGAAYGIGALVITLTTGTGTILSGDLVKFEGDDKLYPVSSFAAGVLTLSAPGLQQAISASAVRVTVRAVVQAMLSGGNVGTTAQVTCHIVTDGTRQDERSIFIQIKER